jgi:hypothetical protein
MLTESEEKALHCAGRLYGELMHWLGYRAGRESAKQDQGEHIDGSKTYGWCDQVQGSFSIRAPRDMAIIASRTIAEARGLTTYQFLRELFEAGDDPYSEIPECERLILAIAYQTRAQREVSFAA